MSASLNDLKAQLHRLPHMTPQQGETIHRFILERHLQNLLELGFYHGTSSCYMAQALKDQGAGRLLTFDLSGSRSLDPNIENLLERCELIPFVDFRYLPHSYNWELMKLLEAHSEPLFDFCYIDGAHTWECDGLAFFLIDKLLKPGGWVVFDDLDWTQWGSPAARSYLGPETPQEQMRAAQVRKIFELLVIPHPSYGNFRVEGEWGFAQKLESTTPARIKEIHIERKYGLGAFLHKAVREVLR